ncbi:MAG: DGQHR domain-containing protein, partial [Candidatus Zixiibacteriota bacterium]
MPAKKEHIEFPCIEITQPIGTFYIASVPFEDLIQITYSDIRMLSEKNEERELDKYLGIERPLSQGRVAELKKYVNLVDATFPSSIILAIKEEFAHYNSTTKIMKVVNAPEIAKIIDGQHRITGLENCQNHPFDLNITLFIDMDIEDQAMVFSTINLKQTKVSKSLTYDLYEYAKSRSPQKTCHNIAKILNSKDGSPFKRKIKILGTATESQQTIS